MNKNKSSNTIDNIFNQTKKLISWLKEHVVIRKIIIISSLFLVMVGSYAAAILSPHESLEKPTPINQFQSLNDSNSTSLAMSDIKNNPKQGSVLINLTASDSSNIANQTDYSSLNFYFNSDNVEAVKNAKIKVASLLDNRALIQISNLKSGWSYIKIAISSKINSVDISNDDINSVSSSTKSVEENNIIFTVTKQKQNETNHNLLDSNLKIISNSFDKQISDQNKNIKILKNKISESSKLIKQNNNQIDKLKQSKTTLTMSEQNEVDSKINEIKSKNDDLTKNISNFNDQILVYKEKINALHSSKNSLNEDELSSNFMIKEFKFTI